SATFANGIDTGGFRQVFNGAGTTHVTGPVSLDGAFDHVGPGKLIIDVDHLSSRGSAHGGETTVNADAAQDIDVAGGGSLDGTGPFNGAIHISSSGELAVGGGTVPGSVAVADLNMADDTANLFLPFGPNNAPASQVNTSGNVALNGRVILALTAQPA